MAETKDIGYFQGLKYDVTLRKRGGTYVLFIPELSCIADDANLDLAYRKLESEKNTYFERMLKEGFHDDIIEPRGRSRGSYGGDSLGRFALKTAIVMVMVMIPMVLGLAFTYKKVSSKINKAADKMTAKVQEVTDKASADFALQFLKSKAGDFNNKIEGMSEAERTELRMKIRKTVRNMKPFVDELKVLIDDASPKKQRKIQAAPAPSSPADTALKQQ